jgi:hypothetical protein
VCRETGIEARLRKINKKKSKQKRGENKMLKIIIEGGVLVDVIDLETETSLTESKDYILEDRDNEKTEER